MYFWHSIIILYRKIDNFFLIYLKILLNYIKTKKFKIFIDNMKFFGGETIFKNKSNIKKEWI